MNDYFDDLEAGLRDVVRHRAHLPWYTRLGQLSVRHRGLAALLAVLVIATPAVAAVGAASGWFSKGSSDNYYPASATSGLGKVLPKDGRLLPIRVADPAGGPPWGVRLVKTTRGETCIQVGRIVDGQIGALGIDGSWNDDHKFHEIKPNDELADICGATDAAGNGFVNVGYHEAPASVNVPLDNRTDSPASSMRLVFVGLLGPDATSITYRTPSGQTKSERTSGGVGAYLMVFRETQKNCGDFMRTALFRIDSNDCQSGGTGATVNLGQPESVTGVTYADGRTCSDEPSASLVSAYHAFIKQMNARFRKESGAEVRAQTDRFFAAHGLTPSASVQALIPQCAPVGWVKSKEPHLTESDVASPLKVKVVVAKDYCHNDSTDTASTTPNVVACNGATPRGYTPFDTDSSGPQALVMVTFTARQPVTNANSWYEWSLGPAATSNSHRSNQGGGGSSTQSNIRSGQRITFTDFLDADVHEVYTGTIRFIQNAGKDGATAPFTPQGSAGIEVGHFTIKLPLTH
jgi:hypothetical protein